MVLKLAEHICEVLNFLDNAAVFITHHVRHELSVQIILLATAGMLVTPLPLDAPNLLTWAFAQAFARYSLYAEHLRNSQKGVASHLALTEGLRR